MRKTILLVNAGFNSLKDSQMQGFRFGFVSVDLKNIEIKDRSLYIFDKPGKLRSYLATLISFYLRKTDPVFYIIEVNELTLVLSSTIDRLLSLKSSPFTNNWYHKRPSF